MACCLSCFHPQAATPTQCLVKPTYSLTASCCYSRQGWNQNLRLFLGAISKLAANGIVIYGPDTMDWISTGWTERT
ncbi:hypothetical protein SORBI_3010G238000 [Sorghum bicolor]|uniref:Uncharacterized protein n=1 Tax=Sorghum bicolor TaxID=4558 RepID=A0A194YL55_SORBI|nr:hypothetical protein SORBI_3010G238000 [Sorghum bicolor]